MKYLVDHPETDRPKIVLGVAYGLQYLHEHDVIHGDLKPHNIIMDDTDVACLCDFGRSKIIGHKGYTTALQAGTAKYMAPELMAVEPPTGDTGENDPLVTTDLALIPNLTKESDVYGFSMLSLEIITGRPPFYYLRTDYMFHTRVIEGERPQKSRYASAVLTEAVWTLLEDCWVQQPSSRPGMGRVVERLEQI